MAPATEPVADAPSSPVAAPAPAQTFVWNWTWNCDPATAPQGLPQAPSGTTVIVWNWHWSCNGAPPPPASVTTATVCVACNIALSVRVASPGDSGDVVQQIGAAAANAVAGIEAAAHVPTSATPAAAVMPAVPNDSAAAAATAAAVPPLPPDPPTVLPAVAPQSGEDPPRHGVSPQDSRGDPSLATRAKVAAPARAPTAGITAAGGAAPSGIGSVPAPPVERHARAAPHDKRAHAGASAPAQAPFRGPAGPAPSDPAPALLTGGQSGGHGSGTSANAALTTMTLAGLLLVFLSRIRSIARPRRRAGPVTQPHPPG
jgi:hypothetical protein